MENESESDEEEDTKKKTRTLSKRKELRKFENMTRQRIRARLERSSIVKHRPLRSRTQDFQRAFLVAETLSCVRDEAAQTALPRPFPIQAPPQFRPHIRTGPCALRLHN